MAKMGRPSILTPELQDKILKYIRAGNYVETAVAACGVSKQSFYGWLKRGNAELARVAAGTNRRVTKDEQIYVDFLDAVDKTQAEAEVRDVLLLAKFAETDPKVVQWRLERKYPHSWGRMDRVAPTNVDDDKIIALTEAIIASGNRADK